MNVVLYRKSYWFMSSSGPSSCWGIWRLAPWCELKLHDLKRQFTCQLTLNSLMVAPSHTPGCLGQKFGAKLSVSC